MGLARENAQVEWRCRGRGFRSCTVTLEERAGHHRSHDEDGRGRHEQPGLGRAATPFERTPHPDLRCLRVAILSEAMATYRELLQQVKGEIDEIDAASARALFESENPVVVDVRERDEWEEGHIPGAVHVPRGNLESRIEAAAPDRARPWSSTAPAAAARPSPRSRSKSSATRTSCRSQAGSPTGSETASPSTCRARSGTSSAGATAAIF